MLPPVRFKFGPFLLDLGRAGLSKDGVPVDIGNKAFALLRALLEARGQVVAKSALMDAAWPNTNVEESNLTVQIAALRKQLQVSPDSEEWIETFPRVGYRFAGSFTVEENGTSVIEAPPQVPGSIVGGEQTVNIAHPVQVYSINQTAISALEASGLQKQLSVRKTRAGWAVAAAALVLFLLGVGLWQFLSNRLTSGESAPRYSIAVLPFANLNSDPQQDYFADGITDGLTTDLSRIPDAFVIARNSAFTYRGKTINAKQVGTELGVRYLLEGSVQRSDNQVRVDAQLVDTETGGQLWADRLDYSLGNLFELQSEITGRIARALDLELVDVESRRGLEERPDDPNAVDLALRGWSIFNKPRARENNVLARQLFNQSLLKEKDNLNSLLGLAVVNVNDIFNNWCDKPDEQLQQARELLDRAFSISPKNAMAYFTKSSILTLEKKPEEAVAAAEIAISLNPNLASVYAWIGNLQIRLGHAEQTIAYVEKALRLSPRDPYLANWLSFIGRAQFYLGRDNEAIDTLHRAAAASGTVSGTYLHLAAAYALTNHSAEAHDALAEFEKLEPNTTISMIKAETKAQSDNATYLKQRERLYDGLRKAGMPE